MLEKAEGFKDSLYFDSNEIPTIGHGINLKDKANQEMLRLQGIDVDGLYKGGTLNPEQSMGLKNKILDRKESELRAHISDDLFDELSPSQQATMMSLMYNSRNLIGPKVRENLAKKDNLGVAREILAYSNPKNELGTLVRRSDEASQFLDNKEEELQNLFRTLTPEEIQRINSILDKTDNEPVKNEYLQKYGKYLNTKTPLNFSKLLK
jgi:GH24 family phage-related lysozyme (muramidase)